MILKLCEKWPFSNTNFVTLQYEFLSVTLSFLHPLSHFYTLLLQYFHSQTVRE